MSPSLHPIQPELSGLPSTTSARAAGNNAHSLSTTRAFLPPHVKPPLHLRVEVRQIPHLLAGKHIFPTNLAVPSTQNITMQAPERTTTKSAQTTRSPLPSPHNRQFHPSPHGLRDPELSPQHLHLQPILLRAPVAEASFERMCGCEGERGVGVGFGRWRAEAEIRAEGIVHAGCGGGVEVWVGGGRVGREVDDAEGLLW